MNPHDADNAMAADYVMGLLDGAEQAAAERRIETDQSFAQAVSAWRGRLADLDLTAEETPPSPALWQRIADATKIAPIDALPSARAALRGATLWDDIRFWRAPVSAAPRCALFAMIMIGALTTSRHLRNDLIALAQSNRFTSPCWSTTRPKRPEPSSTHFRMAGSSSFRYARSRFLPAARCRSGPCGIAPLARNRSASPVSRARCS